MAAQLAGALRPPAQLAGALRPPRIELFFKTPAELKERLRDLTAAGYRSFNLVNKDKKDPMLAWVDVCCEELGPGDDVCAHFSSKYNAKGGPALAERLEALAARSQASGLKLSTLVVSGSGTRKKGHAASDLAGALRAPPSPVGVAFNPYEDDMEKERAALAAKLKGGGVSSVWLQFGVRLDDLDRELAWLRASFPSLELVGSVFLPTKKLIAQQKFRPWNGVALSDEYLSGPEAAERVTRQLLDVYAKHDVRPLVEAPGVRTAKDLAVVSRLFGEPAPPAKKRRL